MSVTVTMPNQAQFITTPLEMAALSKDSFPVATRVPGVEGEGFDLRFLLQYSINREPLVKGQPIRLYVPDGTSACLNVKSVVSLHFVSDAALGSEAGYGFRNEISPNQMTKGLKT